MPASNPLADDLEHVLAVTAGLWEPLRNRSLFLTGGTGFFGRWLLETFAHANTALGLDARAVVLSRNPTAFLRQAPAFANHPSIHFVRGDVCALNAGEVRRQLGTDRSRSFEYVIHAATDSSAAAWAAEPGRLARSVIDGTSATLDFALETGARRFLLTSSGAVYGRQPGSTACLLEDDVGSPDCSDPSSAYGESKRMAELLCACCHREHGLETLIARPFAFVGPFLPLNAHFAIGNFIRDGLRGGPIQVSGDGTPWRSYLYAADLAVWLWTILFRGQPARPYNVGSDEVVTILELARTVSEVLGIEQPPLIALQPQEGTLASRYVPDVRRAAAELGLRSSISLRNAVERTVRWAAANGPGAAHDSNA